VGLGDDIADMLTSDGLSSTIHVGDLKAEPSTAIVVVPTAGLPNLRTFSASVLESRRVQIRARSTDYQVAQALMSSAEGFLDGAKNRTLNGTLYLWIEAVQPQFYVGLDDNERHIFSANFSCLRSVTT